MATVVATCVDRFAGVEPGPQAVAAAFAAQRQRMSALFDSLADRQWQTRSRCTEWTVQQVVRHLVDAATIDGELLRGEGPRNEGGRIDPRTDPAKWLAASDGQSPAETLAAFDAASAAEQAALEQRSRVNGDELLPGPYGPLHWTSLAAHLFWDAWVHERDIVVPLGLGHDATPEEDRLAALYGLAVSATAPTFLGATVTTTILLRGAAHDVYDVEASADGTRVQVVDRAGEAKVSAELGPLVDSLAGRGPDVDQIADGPADVLEQLGMLRAFLVPSA